MDLLFASNNQGKILEVSEILRDHIHLYSLNDFPALAQIIVAETGRSYEENAYQKALAYASLVQFPVIAEDAGLEVEVLNNQPGIYSKRFVKGSDDDRNQAILESLKHFNNRQAKFVATLCFLDLQKNICKYFRGELRGSIAKRPKGSAGFGYDPIFIPTGYDKSLAQLGTKEKNKISHRFKALVKLRAYLKSIK